jgi:hypothetical protein
MSKIQVDEIVNKEDTGAPSFTKGLSVTGVATATSFSGNLTGTASEASAAASGSALETSINNKTSPGKAIALSMVFG